MATGPGCFYGENVNPSGNRKDENGNPSPKEIIFGRKHPAYSTSVKLALPHFQEIVQTAASGVKSQQALEGYGSVLAISNASRRNPVRNRTSQKSKMPNPFYLRGKKQPKYPEESL